jgi:hypothetical protein
MTTLQAISILIVPIGGLALGVWALYTTRRRAPD